MSKKIHRALWLAIVVFGVLAIISLVLFERAQLNMKFAMIFGFIAITAMIIKMFMRHVENHPVVRMARMGWSLGEQARNWWRKRKPATPPPTPQPLQHQTQQPKPDGWEPVRIMSEPGVQDEFEKWFAAGQKQRKEKQEQKSGGQKRLLPYLIPITMGLFLFAGIWGWVSGGRVSETSETPTITQTDKPTPSPESKTAQEKEQKKEERSGSYGVGTILLTILLLGGIAGGVYSYVRSKSGTTTTDELLGNQPFIGALVLIAINVIAWIALGGVWQVIAGYNTGLFIATNLAIVLIVFLLSSESSGYRFGAYALGAILGLGVIMTLLDIRKEYSKGDKTDASTIAEAEGETDSRKGTKITINDPILAVIAFAHPNQFDTEEKVAEAKKLLDEQGVEPWLQSADRWSERLTAPEVTLAFVEAQPGRPSRVVKIPTVVGGYRTYWVSDDDYEVTVNGKKMKAGQPFTETIRNLRFNGTSGPARVRVYLKK